MMPETTVNENDAFVFWKDNIGFSRKVFAIQAKTEAGGMKCGSKGQFRKSPFRSDLAHH
jgi:hypothetical protein